MLTLLILHLYLLFILLITFANSLDLVQARRSGSKQYIPERFFEKVDFEKKNVKLHSRQRTDIDIITVAVI